MARVSKEKLEQLEAWFDEKMPNDLAYKCTLCNETLTHLTKMAEAEVGVGTATVTKLLAERINEHALEHERVNSEALTSRIRRHDGSILSNRQDKLTNQGEPGVNPKSMPIDNEPAMWTCTECGRSYPMDQFPCPCCDDRSEEEPPKERKEEPKQRTQRPTPPPIKRWGNSPEEKAMAEEAMKILKRELSKRYHPDKGGSTEDQQRVGFMLEEFEKYFIVNAELFA